MVAMTTASLVRAATMVTVGMWYVRYGQKSRVWFVRDPHLFTLSTVQSSLLLWPCGAGNIFRFPPSTSRRLCPRLFFLFPQKKNILNCWQKIFFFYLKKNNFRRSNKSSMPLADTQVRVCVTNVIISLVTGGLHQICSTFPQIFLRELHMLPKSENFEKFQLICKLFIEEGIFWARVENLFSVANNCN